MTNFYGYVNLSDNANYQMLYSSQLYGTMFSLFAKFSCKEPTDDDQHYLVEQIEFRIVNYKGNYNLGITRVKDLYHLDDDNESGYIIIKFEVQALKGDVEYTKQCGDFKIPKNNAIIHVERRLAKMYPENIALRNGCFDDEFYYREGLIDDEPQERTPKPLDYDAKVDIDKRDGGSRCPRSKMFVR